MDGCNDSFHQQSAEVRIVHVPCPTGDSRCGSSRDGSAVSRRNSTASY